MFTPFFRATLLLLLASVLACGDAGGGSDTQGTGRVAVTLTDAPTDEFVEVLVTVTRVDLLPGDDETGRQTIFEGRQTFDLLALENVSEPFAIADDVAGGTYSKLRLFVSEIELVRMLADGSEESVFPRLPGGERIDLNPRGGFRVGPGDTLAVQLDMDARRSIQIVGGGNDRYHFRPQVFVDVMRADRVSRLVSVEGVVSRIQDIDGTLRLEVCEIAIDYRDREGSRDHHCLTVFAADGACVFDESGSLTSRDAIDLEDRIAVLGRFTRDEEGDFAVDAEVVEIGGSDAFLTLTGVVSGVYDELSETIVLDVDPGQGFVEGTSLEIDLSEGAKIFTRAGVAVDPVDIAQGAVAEVDGVLELVDDMPDRLRAAILFVRMPETSPES